MNIQSTTTVRAPSARAAGMPRSAIREIMALAAERPAAIHLEVGEPDATTPEHIIEAAARATREGWTKYSPNAGLPPLRKRVAERCARRFGASVGPDRVVITTGAVGGLYTAVMTICDPGDDILVPDPGWPNYESIAHLAGARAVRYPMPAARGFLPDASEIEALVTPRTKAILVNSPGNPTGAVFPRALVLAIAEVARRNGLYVISDEIYEDIVFEGEPVSFGGLGLDDRVFVVSGFSKSFAMTGWRLGWLVCPPALVATATGIQEPLTSCASTPSQKAGEAALAGDQACVAAFRDTFRRRRDILVQELEPSGLLPAIPQGAFYGLVDISRTGLASFDFAKQLLLAHDVATVPGSTFGPSCERFVRVAFTIGDDDLREGFRRMRNFIQGF
jgi:aspartate/methionine/tyrosine aminotransferase